MVTESGSSPQNAIARPAPDSAAIEKLPIAATVRAARMSGRALSAEELAALVTGAAPQPAAPAAEAEAFFDGGAGRRRRGRLAARAPSRRSRRKQRRPRRVTSRTDSDAARTDGASPATGAEAAKTPERPPAPARSRTTERGHFDSVREGFAEGWALDAAKPDRKLQSRSGRTIVSSRSATPSATART